MGNWTYGVREMLNCMIEGGLWAWVGGGGEVRKKRRR